VRSGSGVKSPALASGNSLLARSHGCVTSGTADVQGLSAGHGGQTSKQLHQIGTGESSGNHVNTATGHASVVGDAKGGDDFFDRSGDLAANDVAISLERHDK
jgi:hypothetical protein